MTNYEWIKSLSMKDLAHVLLFMDNDGYYCTTDGSSELLYESALRWEIDWLKKEHKN